MNDDMNKFTKLEELARAMEAIKLFRSCKNSCPVVSISDKMNQLALKVLTDSLKKV